MYLEKQKNIANTSRNFSHPNYFALLKQKNNLFYFFKEKQKNNSGRNNSGQIVIFSKQKKNFKNFLHNSYFS